MERYLGRRIVQAWWEGGEGGVKANAQVSGFTTLGGRGRGSGVVVSAELGGVRWRQRGVGL